MVATALDRSRTTRRTGLPRGLGAVQFVGAVVDGLVLSSITVHAVVGLSLDPATVGLILAVAAAVATLSAPAAGLIADRVGLQRAGAFYALMTSAALGVYVFAGSLTGFAVGAIIFAAAQAAAGSARHAIAVAGSSGNQRTQLRAVMHTLLNAGFGCGTVLGVLVLATANEATFSAAYGLGIALSLATAAATARLRLIAPTSPSPIRARDGWVALRDRPFAAAVALACLVQLTMPILSLLLPVWVLHSGAPPWMAGSALALNTGLVILVQQRWAARLTTAKATATSARLAAAASLIAGLCLFALPQARSALSAATVVLAAVMALTIVEVAGGTAVWQLALTDIKPEFEGRYQATFAMSPNGARVLGALVALPLMLHLGAWAWVPLATVMSAACLMIGRQVLVRRPTQRAQNQ